MQKVIRGRRWGRALVAATATATVVGASLIGATAAFAADHIEPAVNPPLPEVCGIDVGVVLDLSNSLSDDNVAQSKRAVNGVVDALAGTPSAVGVYSFATYGPDGTNDPIQKTALSTPAAVGGLKDRVDGLERVPSGVGGTNWDRGIAQVPAGEYDVVLFVTDGKPTAYGEPSEGGSNRDFGSSADQIDIDRGVRSANALKDAGTRMVGVAVGSGIDVDNIQLVSGQQEDSDYYLTDFDGLANSLEEAALENCKGSLVVQKLVDDGSGDPQPAGGWDFTSPSATDETTQTTDEQGFVTFGYETPADDVTVTETQQDGYRVQQVDGANAVCEDAAGQSVDVNNVDDGFVLDRPLGDNDTIKCQVVNEKILAPGFEVTKSADPASGSEVEPGEIVTYTVTGENTGETDLLVSLEDDLSGVLDYAEYNDDAAATVAGTPAGDPAFDADAAELTWSGDVPVGESVALTYSVTVADDAWGQTLKNIVTGTATPPDGGTITPPPAETEHEVPEDPEEYTTPPEPSEDPSDPEDEPTDDTNGQPVGDDSGTGSDLAVTGTDVTPLVGAGVLLAVIGAAFSLVAWRRRAH